MKPYTIKLIDGQFIEVDVVEENVRPDNNGKIHHYLSIEIQAENGEKPLKEYNSFLDPKNISLIEVYSTDNKEKCIATFKSFTKVQGIIKRVLEGSVMYAIHLDYVE